MKDQRKLEKALFAAARELRDRSTRDVFLERACEDDPDLRSRLERLLAAETTADQLFETSSSHPGALGSFSEAEPRAHLAAAAESPGPLLPDVVEGALGRYRLIACLGEGGGGVVYRAEQQSPVRREVALKLLRFGMANRDAIARFEAERQALAMMDHPAIARVLDAGTTAFGRPYCVMELVQGQRVTDFCDINRLDLRQRLHLFVRICRAIQHAHQKGVIHRDIKPSNILVSVQDGVPMPKVIDFGIAKAIQGRLSDTSLHTVGELFLGTPAYMSPEQASGDDDIDTRTDIYSLGALLYELLTGRTPFDHRALVQNGPESMRHTLREREPAAPSTRISLLDAATRAQTAAARRTVPARLAAALRGDLDCIVGKALEKDRRHRYATADALAQDVERFVANEPIAARPPSRLYQTRKLIRRYRGAFAAAATVVAALTVGLGSSTWLFFRERAARQEAERGRINERVLRREAETRECLAQAASLAGQNRFAEADQLLARHPFPATTLEGATVFRTLGDWAAGEGRWARATQYFDRLLRIDLLETSRISTLDQTRSAAALVAMADFSGYETFRRAAVRQFEITRDAPAAERTIKNCLLRPADAELLATLSPLADLAAETFSRADADAVAGSWGCVSLALFELRRARYEAAIDWSRRSLAFGDTPAVRAGTVYAVLSMACRRLGREKEADIALAAGHAILQGRTELTLEIGDGAKGFWFDWVIAQLLLREADAC